MLWCDAKWFIREMSCAILSKKELLHASKFDDDVYGDAYENLVDDLCALELAS